MEKDDVEFEQYLRQFRALRPPALASAKTSPAGWPRVVAVAAVILLMVSVPVWMVRRTLRNEGHAALSASVNVPRATSRKATVGGLAPLLRLDAVQRDQALTELSAKVLPDVNNPKGALYLLAQR